MPHLRQTIRETVKALLVAASTGAATRVFETRVVPWRTVELPAISVYTLDETSAHNNTAPRELTRELTLEIVAAVRATTDVDDQLDDLALQIERAMHRDWTLGNVVADSVLASTEIGVESSGDKPIGMVRLNYTITYRTNVPEDEDVADLLTDLQEVDTKFNVGGGQDPRDQAEDDLTGLDQ
jgi:hypothetical protein